MVERSRRRRDMNNMTKGCCCRSRRSPLSRRCLPAGRTRWCRTTGGAPAVTTVQPGYLSHGIGVDESQFADRRSGRAQRRLRTEGRSGRRGGQRGVRHVSRQDGDRGARGASSTDQQPSVRAHRGLGARDEASRDGHAADRVVCQ